MNPTLYTRLRQANRSSERTWTAPLRPRPNGVVVVPATHAPPPGPEPADQRLSQVQADPGYEPLADAGRDGALTAGVPQPETAAAEAPAPAPRRQPVIITPPVSSTSSSRRWVVLLLWMVLVVIDGAAAAVALARSLRTVWHQAGRPRPEAATTVNPAETRPWRSAVAVS